MTPSKDCNRVGIEMVRTLVVFLSGLPKVMESQSVPGGLRCKQISYTGAFLRYPFPFCYCVTRRCDQNYYLSFGSKAHGP